MLYILLHIFSATPGVDYTPLSTTLVFAVGSSKRHRICANVPIVGNREIHSHKSFGLRADILSPSSASFGGSARSSSGTIEAVIVDDDGEDHTSSMYPYLPIYRSFMIAWMTVIPILVHLGGGGGGGGGRGYCEYNSKIGL